MKTKNRSISFYAEYTDRNGLRHFAIHKYNPITGFVLMMRDFKDDNACYASTPDELKCADDHTLDQPYIVVRRINLIENKHEYLVWDSRNDTKIAIFFSEKEAIEFCEQKNLDLKYGDNEE